MKATGPGRFIRPEGMEVACIAPGRWRVEGYDVERHNVDGTDWWHVFQRVATQVRESEPWAVHETFHGKRRTLTEACGLVDDLQAAQANC